MNTETEIKTSQSLEVVFANCENKDNTASDKSEGTHGRIKAQITPVIAVLLSVVTVLSVALIVVAVCLGNVSSEVSKLKKRDRGLYDKSDVVLTKETDRIYTYNYAYGDVAIPAIPGVPKSTYKTENFSTNENGFKEYYENGELRSYVGIDVSEMNGTIDWDKVKDDGVDFVIIRVGGRGWGSTGVMYTDSKFLENLEGAKDAGLMVGAYFFSQAITPEEAVEEAELAIDILDGAKLDYPLAYDWENIDGVGARTDNLDPDTMTECARAFCDKVEDEGYKSCLYLGAKDAYYKYDLGQLADIDIWYAFYNDTPGLYYNYMIWQYSASGKVEGISGDVDLNICFKNYK